MNSVLDLSYEHNCGDNYTFIHNEFVHYLICIIVLNAVFCNIKNLTFNYLTLYPLLIVFDYCNNNNLITLLLLLDVLSTTMIYLCCVCVCVCVRVCVHVCIHAFVASMHVCMLWFVHASLYTIYYIHPLILPSGKSHK